MLRGVVNFFVLCVFALEWFVLCVRLFYQVLRRGFRVFLN